MSALEDAAPARRADLSALPAGLRGALAAQLPTGWHALPPGDGGSGVLRVLAFDGSAHSLATGGIL